VIDNRCINTSECEIKNSEEECRSGCKHSGSTISSSCVVDECGRYDLNTCPNNECVLINQLCINAIESNLCINQHTIESCLCGEYTSEIHWLEFSITLHSIDV
jgi:hypothetical protein